MFGVPTHNQLTKITKMKIVTNRTEIILNLELDNKTLKHDTLNKT